MKLDEITMLSEYIFKKRELKTELWIGPTLRDQGDKGLAKVSKEECQEGVVYWMPSMESVSKSTEEAAVANGINSSSKTKINN